MSSYSTNTVLDSKWYQITPRNVGRNSFPIIIYCKCKECTKEGNISIVNTITIQIKNNHPYKWLIVERIDKF